MEPVLIAIVAALVYGAISWRLGDVFPFSRYAMYADLGGRDEGAVLYVRVDGRDVGFDEVVAWHGVDPEAIEPFTVPCSLHWVVFEAQRWISEHSAPTAEGSPDAVEIGFRLLRVLPDGSLSETLQRRASGRGRLRR